MIKRKIKILSFISFAILYSSCFLSVPNETILMDYQVWNNNTFLFIEKKCQIKINDRIKLGKEAVPVKIKGEVYNTLKDYLESKIKIREQLISYLKEEVTTKKIIFILESYSIDKGNIMVSINGKQSISFTILNDKLNANKSERTEKLDPLFNPLQRDEKACVSTYGSIPQNLRIISSFDISSNTLTTYQISMYD